MSDGSGSLTYRELEDRANRGARLLRSLGNEKGDTKAYWLPNCLEVFEVYWAGQRAGLYITPIATR
ncbi:acyl-CoA synthetase (AMP-forming)/AMP-acid ligase II [Porphyrobacter sp. MBR-155]|jgi:acyl-CoA synthetase (AMP-forming)/AMP-acid ligase II